LIQILQRELVLNGKKKLLPQILQTAGILTSKGNDGEHETG
jgi:hypothetical protein